MFKSISQYIKFTTSKETLKGFFSQKCGNFLPCPVAISVHLHYCRDFIFFFSKKNLADICRIIIHTFFSFCYFCGSEKKGNKPRTVLHFIFLLAQKNNPWSCHFTKCRFLYFFLLTLEVPLYSALCNPPLLLPIKVTFVSATKEFVWDQVEGRKEGLPDLAKLK